MSIIVKVKGVDDFGKQGNGATATYQMHYPRPKKNDIMLFYYPTTNALGIYQMKEETSCYEDREGFSHYEGVMRRLNLDAGIEATVTMIKQQQPELGNAVEQELIAILNKYQK